jgi:hypothetical protein
MAFRPRPHRTVLSTAVGAEERTDLADMTRTNFPAQLSGAVEPRITSRHGSASIPLLGVPSSAANTARAAALPTSSRFMSTLVSGGRASAARISQLSKPSPRRRRVCDGHVPAPR